MKQAIVLSETPNGMPTKRYTRRLSDGSLDLGPTFNAMREKQRKDSTFWQGMANASANCAVNQANWCNAAQAQQQGQLGGLYGCGLDATNYSINSLLGRR